jgi:hypothetical protein
MTSNQALVDAHIMFKDMSVDTYLTAAGIASDWPHGRGVYVSSDKGFIIWVGEEDHLRIMCMQKGTVSKTLPLCCASAAVLIQSTAFLLCFRCRSYLKHCLSLRLCRCSTRSSTGSRPRSTSSTPSRGSSSPSRRTTAS